MLGYKTSGSGRAVVLLHGFLESSSIWNNINFENNEIMTIDLPGHGRSSDVVCSSIVDMAELVKETIESTNICEYDVVGHSMGGYVALELVKLHQACKRVVLLNSNFWEDSPQKKLDRKRVAELVMQKKDHFIIEAIPICS